MTSTANILRLVAAVTATSLILTLGGCRSGKQTRAPQEQTVPGHEQTVSPTPARSAAADFRLMTESYTPWTDVEVPVKVSLTKPNKDYTNSSKSSSQSPNHNTIPNGREKSGKKPGGQKGHIHHERKHMVPTRDVAVPAPSIYKDDPNFKETGRIIRKQLVNCMWELKWSSTIHRNSEIRQQGRECMLLFRRA